MAMLAAKMPWRQPTDMSKVKWELAPVPTPLNATKIAKPYE